MKRKRIRSMLKKGHPLQTEKFICNHCGRAVRLEDWIQEGIGIVDCPKCGDWIMGLGFMKKITEVIWV